MCNFKEIYFRSARLFPGTRYIIHVATNVIETNKSYSILELTPISSHKHPESWKNLTATYQFNLMNIPHIQKYRILNILRPRFVTKLFQKAIPEIVKRTTSTELLIRKIKRTCHEWDRSWAKFYVRSSKWISLANFYFKYGDAIYHHVRLNTSPNQDKYRGSLHSRKLLENLSVLKRKVLFRGKNSAKHVSYFYY